MNLSIWYTSTLKLLSVPYNLMRELIRYTRILMCISTLVFKNFKLTIIYEKNSYLSTFIFLENIISQEKT